LTAVIGATFTERSGDSGKQAAKVKNAYLAIFAGMAISACSTRPLAPERLTLVPHDRMLSMQYAQPRADTQKIVVIRDGGTLLGAAGKMMLSVDGVQTANLAPDEYVALYLPWGRHSLSVGAIKLRAFPSDVTLDIGVPDAQTEYRIDMSVSEIRIHPAGDETL
jgi:hypothetical protein